MFLIYRSDKHLVCLSGGRTTGEQKLNGRTKSKATLARVMGYVEQNDIHTPALTVVESLKFSAHLRLDRNVKKRQENKFIDNVSLVFSHWSSWSRHEQLQLLRFTCTTA